MKVQTSRSRFHALAVLAIAGALLAGCSSDDGKSASSATTANAATTTTAKGPAKIRIMVTNDDGIGAPGLDALVQGLRGLENVDVVVVAPATNQSGTGDKTTPGTLSVADATTASGYAGKAVAGFPADTVDWAIKDGNVEPAPDLVMSGINQGQNIGSSTGVSGTFGAAKTAAALGVPAIAVSQGLGTPPDYPSGVKYALDWLASHRSELAGKGRGSGPATLWNLNAPTCGTTGTPRGVVDVPIADASKPAIAASNCSSTETSPKDDVDALNAGFVPLTEIKAA